MSAQLFPLLLLTLRALGASAAPSPPLGGPVGGNGSNPTFEMCLGDRVLWYVMAYGSASHVFHIQGNGYKYLNTKQYATSVNDRDGKVFIMDATRASL